MDAKEVFPRPKLLKRQNEGGGWGGTGKKIT